jgi:beta-glucanase (GH16 family)
MFTQHGKRGSEMIRRLGFAAVVSFSALACSSEDQLAAAAVGDSGSPDPTDVSQPQNDSGAAPLDASVEDENLAIGQPDADAAGADATGEDVWEGGPDARTYAVRDADWSDWNAAANGDGGGLDMTGWRLVWSDEFNGPLDESAWTPSDLAVPWNHELEAYSPSNVSFENGALVLEARVEDYLDCKYTSGKIDTDGKKSWVFGRFVARIKLPTVQAMWPAFWLVSATGGWPAGGELDIMEARGRVPGETSSAAHWAAPNHVYVTGNYTFPAPQNIGGWHEYAMEWTDQMIIWSVDGKEFWRRAWQLPFDHEFFMLLNLAVGGDFDFGFAPPADMPPQRMYVDWVRVYQKP